MQLRYESVAAETWTLSQVITPLLCTRQAFRRRYPMSIQRVLVWVGAMALIIFVFVTYKSVNTLKTTVQEHTAALDRPVIAAEVFPGSPQHSLNAGTQRRRVQISRLRTFSS
jgi:hypothetical protein